MMSTLTKAGSSRSRLRLACAVAVAGSLAVGVSGCTGVLTPKIKTPTSSPSSTTAPNPQSASANGNLSSVPSIVREVEPSVVTIRTSVGLGSGVVYRKGGVIVTDAHVVENEQKRPFSTVEVQFADGTNSQATVVGVDDLTDVAVVKTKRTNLPVPSYSQAVPEVGALTVVIGSPLGLTESVTAGIVSALHRNMPPSQESPQGLIDLLQTDAPISPGNSGGAVANGKSQIIGLSEAYLAPSSGAVAIGFVTPASTVTNAADQLLASGTVKHAFLGAVPQEITPQIAQRFDLSTTSGALIIDVTRGGPAASAGIKPGDIITKFAGTKVTSVTDLLAALRKADPKQKVEVSVKRGTSTKTFPVTLSDRPKM